MPENGISPKRSFQQLEKQSCGKQAPHNESNWHTGLWAATLHAVGAVYPAYRNILRIFVLIRNDDIATKNYVHNIFPFFRSEHIIPSYGNKWASEKKSYFIS